MRRRSKDHELTKSVRSSPQLSKPRARKSATMRRRRRHHQQTFAPSTNSAMYHGHFATGLFIQALFPSVPPAAVFYGSAMLDLIDGINVALGVSRVSPDPSAGPYLPMRLDFIDWDHSFALALAWSFLFSLYYARTSLSHSVVAFFSVFSHWLDDWLVHNNDLALYPYSDQHYGYGIWTKLSPYRAWAFEAVFCLLFCVAAIRMNSRRGIISYGPHVLVVLLALSMTPHTAPTHLVLRLPKQAARFVGGPLVTIGMAVPAHLLTRMVTTAEEQASKRQGKKKSG